VPSAVTVTTVPPRTDRLNPAGVSTASSRPGSMTATRSARASASAMSWVMSRIVCAAAWQTRMYDHALATGFSLGYLVSAGVLALAAIIALAMIRVRGQDLSGADPTPEPAGDATSPSRA
jgi:hypothetical protein